MKERNERKRIVSAAIDIQKYVCVDCKGRLRGLGGRYLNFAPKHGLSTKFPGAVLRPKRQWGNLTQWCPGRDADVIESRAPLSEGAI